MTTPIHHESITKKSPARLTAIRCAGLMDPVVHRRGGQLVTSSMPQPQGPGSDETWLHLHEPPQLQ